MLLRKHCLLDWFRVESQGARSSRPSDLMRNAMSGIKIHSGHWITQQILRTIPKKKYLKLLPFKVGFSIFCFCSPKDIRNICTGQRPKSWRNGCFWRVPGSCMENRFIKSPGCTTHFRSYVSPIAMVCSSSPISLHLQSTIDSTKCGLWKPDAQGRKASLTEQFRISTTCRFTMYINQNCGGNCSR